MRTASPPPAAGRGARPAVWRAAGSATEVQRDVLGGRSSAADVVRQALERIQAMEPQLQAWTALDPPGALAQARALDEQLRRDADPASRACGPSGRLLLAGVPLGVKDLYDTASLPTAYGSPVYRDHQPEADAAVVAAARAAGGIVIGKTVTTEFAYFTPGPTANPWHPAHTPGGSSSGSAAAVASGMVPLAFGSQTAGSLIRPASYCGVFALKPTHGAFPLAGVKGLAPSLDTVGWLARSADDLELMRCALAGEPFVPLAAPAATALRIGACRTHEAPAWEPAGAQAWARGVAAATAAGAAVRPIELPADLQGLLQAQKTVMAWEACRSLAPEHTRHRDRLSPSMLDLLESGRAIGDDAYRAAQALAARGREWLDLLMDDLDALLVPAAPGEAPAGRAATGDPVFSRVWTLLGLPCVNVPGLQGPNGLPIGVQLIGRRGQERALLAVAAALQPGLLSAARPRAA